MVSIFMMGMKGHFEYENLDNLQHGIHDYFKFLKFGFARATDQLCISIRRGLKQT